MKRFVLIAAVVLATTGGSARADVFAVVSDAAPAVPATAVPSAAVPNAAGSVVAGPPSGPAQQLDYQELVGIWQSAGAAYGIPWQVLGAINKVESNFGRNMGPSSAGAVGWMQFMPDTWSRWGVDANADGIADPWNAQDAVYAAARYLAASGGQSDISRAVFSYNHAQWYVDEVLGIASTISTDGTIGTVGGGLPATTTTFAADPMAAVRVQQAQQELDDANAQLEAAQADEQQVGTVADALAAQAEAAAVLSDRLDVQKQAVLAGVRHDDAVATVASLQDRVDQATAALEQARASSTAPLFQPGIAGAPVAQGDYVFPVGGGPSQVSVGHTHHDYPAADIAAPEGAPVYALHDAVVQNAWQAPDPRCGTGLTLLGSDGLSWTYCHLSYLDPTVVTGSALTAGQLIGQVGQSGDATGPHLHLQLNPQSGYPQAMPWFQGFAGSAFSWQDAPTPAAAPAAPSAPVFAVVSEASTPDVITFTAR